MSLMRNFDQPELRLLHRELVLHCREDQNHLGDDDRPEEGDVHCTHSGNKLVRNGMGMNGMEWECRQKVEADQKCKP